MRHKWKLVPSVDAPFEDFCIQCHLYRRGGKAPVKLKYARRLEGSLWFLYPPYETPECKRPGEDNAQDQ